MNFGTKFKNLRTQKQLTQLQMAEILKTSKSNISKYESGSIEPNLETLIKISRFFDVPIDYLLGNEHEVIDAPAFIKIDEPNTISDTDRYFLKTLTDRERNIIDVYRQLNEDNQDIIIGEMKKFLKEQRLEAAASGKYQKEA